MSAHAEEGQALLLQDANAYDVDTLLQKLGSTASVYKVEHADFMIMFPMCFDDVDNSQGNEIDGTDMLSTIFASGYDSSQQDFPCLEATCRDKKPTLEKVRKALLEDLNQWLPHQGFDVKYYTSARCPDSQTSTRWERCFGYLFNQIRSQIDADKLFMRISIAGPDVECRYAEKQGVRLQTSYDVLAPLGIKQPPPPETAEPYIPYEKEFLHALQEELGMEEREIFRRGCTSLDGSILRPVDRLRIMRRVIEEKLNLQRCVDRGLIVADFACHSKQSITDFEFNWGTLRPSNLLNLRASQPSACIKDYFGETTAFYFEWIGFTIRAFVPLAVLGVAMAIIEKIEFAYRPFDTSVHNFWSIVWATIVVVWGTLYMVRWRRYQYKLRVEWDTLNNVTAEIMRPCIHGVMKNNPLNENEKTLQYPCTLNRLGMVMSLIVSTVFFGLVWGGVTGIYSLRPMLDEQFGTDGFITGEQLVSWALSAQIATMNILWEQVARLLTRVENQRTVNDHAASLRSKLFVMQLYNTYSPLLYLALIQRYWGSDSGDPCPDDDCVSALQQGLYSTLGGLLLGQLKQMFSPYLKLKMFGWMQTKQLEAKYGQVIKDKIMSAEELPKLSFMEQQGLMQEYDIDHQVSDFQSLTLTLSYVLVFSGVTPLLGIVALPIFLLRLRVDAWKMCVLLRRPFPYMQDGIGPWNVMIDSFMWVGLVCSVAIPLLNFKRFDKLDAFHKLLAFFVIERILVLVKLACGSLFPEKSSAVQLMLDRQAYVLDRLHGIKSRMNHIASEVECAPVVSRATRLDRAFEDEEEVVWRSIRPRHFTTDDYV